MSSIPSYSMESLLLGVKVSCLLLFAEKSYKGFKIVKILKKGYKTKKAPSRIRTWTAREFLIRKICLTPYQLGHRVTLPRGAYFKINKFYDNLFADSILN